MDRSQIIEQARQAGRKDQEDLSKQKQDDQIKRQLEKSYLTTVLKTQMEGKKHKGEKRNEILTSLLYMNKLPYKISHHGKSDVIKDNI
jgi:hypothetical protein